MFKHRNRAFETLKALHAPPRQADNFPGHMAQVSQRLGFSRNPIRIDLVVYVVDQQMDLLSVNWRVTVLCRARLTYCVMDTMHARRCLLPG